MMKINTVNKERTKPHRNWFINDQCGEQTAASSALSPKLQDDDGQCCSNKASPLMTTRGQQLLTNCEPQQQDDLRSSMDVFI